MSSVDLATDLRRPFQASRGAVPSPSLQAFHFDRAGEGEALNEVETSEFAARLLDAESEADFDHLLGAIMTHSAIKVGSSLTPALGNALGGYLKRVARASRLDPAPGQTLGLELDGLDKLEQEFETNLHFVRLAGKAAREVARRGEVVGSPRLKAGAVLQNVAPDLLRSLAFHSEPSGRWVRLDDVIVVHDAAGVSRRRTLEPALGIEAFEYDPEMEYFLGGLIKSAGRAVKSAVHTVADLSSSVADTLGKVPIIGAGLKGLYGYSYGALIQSADSAVSGVRLDKVLSRHFESQIKNIKEVAPYVQTVISVVPGIGPGVSGAISAGVTLAQGRPISEALVDAAAGALPGGALAKSMAKMAFTVASGKPISDIAISALPLSAAAKDGLKAGLRVASDVAQGKRVDKALIAEANRQIDSLPPAFRTAAQVGVAFSQGKRVQDIALKQLPNLIAVGGRLASAGQQIAASSPAVRQARALFAKGQHGFDVAQGLMAIPAMAPYQIERARQTFKGEALKGFDAAMAMHQGRGLSRIARHPPRP